jgi:hypothetical protein
MPGWQWLAAGLSRLFLFKLLFAWSKILHAFEVRRVLHGQSIFNKLNRIDWILHYFQHASRFLTHACMKLWTNKLDVIVVIHIIMSSCENCEHNISCNHSSNFLRYNAFNHAWVRAWHCMHDAYCMRFFIHSLACINSTPCMHASAWDILSIQDYAPVSRMHACLDRESVTWLSVSPAPKCLWP